jgi:hypothetical protein
MAPQGQTVLVLATRSDWTSVLLPLEHDFEVKYLVSGMFENQAEVYNSYVELPDFGKALYGSTIAERRYLVLAKEAPVHFRTVHLNTGEVRYVSDHGNNPDSVVFSPGGVYVGGEKAIIQGEISKLSKLPASTLVFKTMLAHVRKNFKVVKAYRLGREAEMLAAEGYRLTSDTRGNPNYDLKL